MDRWNKTWDTFSALIYLGFSSCTFQYYSEEFVSSSLYHVVFIALILWFSGRQACPKCAFVQLGAVNFPSPRYRKVFQLTLAPAAAPSPSPGCALCCRLRVVGSLSALSTGSAAHHILPFFCQHKGGGAFQA